MTKINYGWDKAGNCLWCGEAGRCQCDHTRLVEDISKKIAALPDLIEALKNAQTTISEICKRRDPSVNNGTGWAYPEEQVSLAMIGSALDKAGV